MIYNPKGQTDQFGGKVFTVGGTVLRLWQDNITPSGTVLTLYEDEKGVPAAVCGFEDSTPKSLPLEQLVPVSPLVPDEKGRQYVLYYLFDGSDGQWADVLGISSDIGVLVQKMLEDVRQDRSISAVLTFEGEDPENGIISFTYESGEDSDPFYLNYMIKQAPVYPKCDGEAGI